MADQQRLARLAQAKAEAEAAAKQKPPVFPPPPTVTAAVVQQMIDAAIAPLKAAIASFSQKSPTPLPIPSPVPTPVTVPKLAPSVFKQPIELMTTWVSRGIRVMWGWEEERDPSTGLPTKNLADYLDAAHAAGATVLVQLDAAQPIPWNHSAISGFVQPDEPDDAEVNLQDAGNAAGLETYYATLEGYYATAKKNRPDLPVYVNIDGAQVEWKKVDYLRDFRAADGVVFDYYEDARGITFADWCDRFALVKSLAGPKLCGAFVGTSFQNLGATYYPNERAPTADEVRQVIDFLKSQGMAWPLFPQSFDPFRYDSTPADIVAVIQAEAIK